jgi:DNA-binding transcriptional regulator YhcF (GntR family)
VAEAYRLLAQEGWLDLRRHHGATIRDRKPLRAQPERRNDFTQRLRELAAQAISDGLDTGAVAEQLSRLAADLKRNAPL